MNVKEVCNTLRPLFDLSDDVTEANFHFERTLATHIQSASKRLEAMTLTEIRQLIDQAKADYYAQIGA